LILSHRGINELGVAIALVRRDLLTNPIGQRNRLAKVLKLNFGHNKTGILPGEFIHLPQNPFVEDLVTGLLDQRTAAEFEYLLGLFDGYLILELGPHNSLARTFDRQKGTGTGSSYPDCHIALRQIPLTVALTGSMPRQLSFVTRNLRSISTGMDALPSNLQGRICGHRQSREDNLVSPKIGLALDREKSSQSVASTIDPTLDGANDTAANFCGLFVGETLDADQKQRFTLMRR
jgi:hypothetical protein